jgi:transposase InsO family protein
VTVSGVCRKTKVSRQNHYARRNKRQRRVVDEGLVVALVTAERRIQPRLGARKLHFLLAGPLAEAGASLGRDRFFKVMRGSGLLLEPKPAERPSTTNSSHYLPVFKNLIKERVASRPNEVWVADLTYLRTEEGFMYLSLVTDKSSRKVVGYHCGETLEAAESLTALENALAELPAGAKPVHHSDRGSQYCSHEYVNLLVANGLLVSMTETNHCAENALAERVNGILKSEYGLGCEFKTRASARKAAAQAVHLYNTRRPHTALDYRTPEEAHGFAA